MQLLLLGLFALYGFGSFSKVLGDDLTGDSIRDSIRDSIGDSTGETTVEAVSLGIETQQNADTAEERRLDELFESLRGIDDSGSQIDDADLNGVYNDDYIGIAVHSNNNTAATKESSEYYRLALQVLATVPKGPPGVFTYQTNIHSSDPGFFQILDKLDEWLDHEIRGAEDRLVDNDNKKDNEKDDDDQYALRYEEGIVTKLTTPSRVHLQHEDAFALLQKSADLGDRNALRLLADSYFYGNYSTQRNLSRALTYYHDLAGLGDADAQFMCGLYYSTGLFGTVPVDQVKASLYYTVAAENGNVRAKLALANRFLTGIAGPINLRKAFQYYLSAADDAYNYLFPQGDLPFTQKFPGRDGTWLLPIHEQSGVYGKFVGRSYTDSSSQGISGSQLDKIFGVLHYSTSDYNREGAILAFRRLAELYYEGLRFITPDWELSAQLAQEGVRKIWAKNGNYRSGVNTKDAHVIIHGGECAYMLGRYYLMGQGGLAKNVSEGAKWIRKGAELGHSGCKTALAQLYLFGIGVPQDKMKAIDLATSVSSEGGRQGHLILGKLRIKTGLPDEGKRLIRLAASKGSLEATYLDAQFKKEAFEAKNWEVSHEAVKDLCRSLKQFVERVEDLHSPLIWAQTRYGKGDYESAILGFLIGAEEGYYSAQINLAYLLDDQGGYIDLRTEKARHLHSFNETKSLETALVYWGRAAKQARDPNHSALLKLGDYYLAGKGTAKDPAKAFACYHSASYINNGLANWNLGWMYENGIGVEKDYHLAKRYYDLSMLSHGPPHIATWLSLARLYVKSFWNDSTGGKVKSVMGETSTKVPFKEALQKLWSMWRDRSLLPEETGQQQSQPQQPQQQQQVPQQQEQLDAEFEEDYEEEDTVADFAQYFTIGLLIALIGLVMLRFNRIREGTQWAQGQMREQQRQRPANADDDEATTATAETVRDRPLITFQFGVLGLGMSFGGGGVVPF